MTMFAERLLVKIFSIIMIAVLAIVGVIAINTVLSRRVETSISALAHRDILISQYAHDANAAFLNMDDQSNMWVGLYRFHNASLSTATLKQIEASQDVLNGSLRKLTPLLAGRSQAVWLAQAKSNARTYESFWNQVRRYNYTDHLKATQIMYLKNSAASNALTSSLARIDGFGRALMALRAGQAISTAHFMELVELIGGAISIVLSGVVLWMLHRLLSPIRTIADRAQQIAAGELGGAQLAVRSRDEIGMLAKGFNAMLHNLRDVILQVKHASQEVAETAAQLREGARHTSDSTEQIAGAMEEVASGAEQQSASTDAARTTVNGISDTAERIAGSTSNSAAAAQVAVQLATEGNAVIRRVVDQMTSIQSTVSGLNSSMQSLTERSSQIGDVVKVISDIAAQTALLALNASIEAARAGEHGYGFTVVATEVKKLAEETARSAEEIAVMTRGIRLDTEKSGELTHSVVREVASGITATESAGASFANIERAVSDVAQQIRDNSQAARNMSEEVRTARAAIAEVSNVAMSTAASTEEVSAAAQEQLAAMEEILASASSLAQTAEDLQQRIAHFQL